MFSKPKRGGYKQRPSLFDFVNSKIIRKFVVSNCSSEVCMAKVGLENDTLNPPKCPSNWEYSTGQRQLLDIQSGEQMDRLSFSAPKARKGRENISTFFFCLLGYVTYPPNPLSVKGAYGAESVVCTSDPKMPPCQGVRGCKYSSREMPANAGSWLVFRSKTMKDSLSKESSLFDYYWSDRYSLSHSIVRM